MMMAPAAFNRGRQGRLRRLEIPEMRKAPCRRQAGDVERLLQGHGDAEQRQPLAAAKRGIGGARGLSGAIEIANDDRVDRPVQGLDARDRMLEQFRCRNLRAYRALSSALIEP